MKFLERFLQPNPREVEAAREQETLLRLHPAFTRAYGPWVGNQRYFDLSEADLKVRFAFSDPALLNDCPLPVKIGSNLDPALSEPYIGFAYGSRGEKGVLQEWAARFPYAELIEGLDAEGVIKTDSKVTVLGGVKDSEG